MSHIEVDAAVLDALAGDLEAYMRDLRAILAEASGLGAGPQVAKLADCGAWAESQIPDLRARARLVREEDEGNPVLDGFGISALSLVGGSKPISEQMQAIAAIVRGRQIAGAGGLDWSRKPNESLDDWQQRVLGYAIDRVARVPGAGKPLADVYDWYSTYGNVLASWTATTMVTAKFAKALSAPYIERMLLDPAVVQRLPSMLQRLAPAGASAMNSWKTFGAPGQPGGLLGGRAISTLVDLEHGQGVAALTQRIRTLGFPQIADRFAAAESQLNSMGRIGGNIFGRPILGPAGEVVTARNVTNLISVARTAPAGSRMASVLRTGGALRTLGVAGSGASTLYDGANLISQGNPVEAFKRDKAGYVSDVAKTGFDASMTAALVAPSPVTWGAVGVTGVAWGASEVVDHWDDVKKGVSDAADFTWDRGVDVANFTADRVYDLGQAGKDFGNFTADRVYDLGQAGKGLAKDLGGIAEDLDPRNLHISIHIG